MQPWPAVARLARSGLRLLVLAALSACRSHVPGASSATPDGATFQRSTDAVRRDGNHLVGAGSIYLEQHSHNPVDWYPWSPEALARARALDRPIFLSIGYSSCHWCHVMEAEVFEKDDAAAFLNAHFVSIKVDREERPDLDETYMRSLLAMTGSGGWPMSLFLTPALTPFFGASYVPHDRFLALARKVAEQFASARADVEGQGEEVLRWISREDEVANAPPITATDLHAIATSALERVDMQWGGFRGEQKFPTPVRWELLLHAARKWGDPPLTAAVRVTLDAMAAGGIRDPIGGGFHRYSTDPRWEVPHFEKMLYDNAQLGALYLEAGLAFRERRYVEVGIDTLDFLLREMQAPDGGFYASFDADSGGREGAFYVWAPEELNQIDGPSDGPVLARILRVDGEGTFGGASAPNRRTPLVDVAAASGRSLADVAKLWAASHQLLMAARARRPPPRVDTKIVTAWNGLAIAALARGFEATADVRYRDAALRAADWLWRTHRRAPSGLFRASNAGRAEEAGVLDDYAFLARGLIALFEASGRAELLDRALTLVKEADERFRAPDRSGWYGAEAGTAPFTRSVSLEDAVEPSGSAVLLADRVALGALTLRGDLTRAVDEALRARAKGVRANGMGSAGWLDAALMRVGPFYDVVVAGDERGAVDRLEEVRRAMAPMWTVSTLVPASGPEASFGEIVAAAKGKTAGSATAKAYVCVEGACRAPTSDPTALRALLLEGWSF